MSCNNWEGLAAMTKADTVSVYVEKFFNKGSVFAHLGLTHILKNDFATLCKVSSAYSCPPVAAWDPSIATTAAEYS
jgi:hypothetical protein